MPVCAFGSELQPGRPSSIHLDSSIIASYMPPDAAWILYLLPFIPAIDLDLGAFCALEPPADVEFTADDARALIGTNIFGGAVIAGEKLAQKVHVYLWYFFCQCISASTPAPPSFQTAPTDLPVINPVGSNPVVGVCDSVGSPQLSVGPSQFVNLVSRRLPAGAQTVTVTMRHHSNGATHGGIAFLTAWYNERGVQVRSEATVNVAIGGTATQTYSVPANAAIVDTSFTSGPSSITDQGSASHSVACGAAALPQPAPLNPQLQATLTNILELVTLIQRQAVPFAYVEKASHLGLTGNGSFAVQGLLAMRAEVQSYPVNGPGVEYGNPNRLHIDSWVQWGTSDGVTDRQVLIASNQLIVPPIGGVYTSFHYSLAPGVEVDFVELAREP